MVDRRLKRNGRLFSFLRRWRHELFDDDFQRELGTMYSDMPRGTPPKPPALLAMVTLLQAYEQKSDAAAVEEAVFDRRWQMVLDCIGTDEPIFSQGVLVDFRRRLVEHDMDRRLVERTVELAKRTGDFGDKQLKVAFDSSPLWGVGRVEDTFNLLGHALEVVVQCAAAELKTTPAAVRAEAGVKLLGGSSLKANLDIDWDDPIQQQSAMERLLGEVRTLRAWLQRRLPDQIAEAPFKEALALVEQVISQDLEPDPNGKMRIRRGVSKNRRISVTDPDIRHGRKSKSKPFNGYKRHVARDLEHGLILAAAVRPANEAEAHAADLMRPEVEHFGAVEEIHIDRAYLSSNWTRESFRAGKRILAKPWPCRNRNLFPKTHFTIDLNEGTVRCPEGATAPIKNGTARFAGSDCSTCVSRSQCTRAAAGRGRSISIHPDEAMLIQLRQLKATPDGRQQLRRRTAVEHTLAHVGRRQGPRARYRGVRMNTLDLRRTCAVENLHRLDQLERAA